MQDEAEKNPDENIQKLAELLKDMRIAMLTTQDPDGALRSRPMSSQEIDFDGDLWFFTSKTSGKAHSIVADQQVNVAYVSHSALHPCYISITGRADLIEDQEKAKELWNPVYRAWFPEGLEDPDLSLIRIRVDSAEYWESPSASVVHLLGFDRLSTKAVLKEAQETEHGKLEIHH